jgi:hypothetical protein
MTSHAKLDEMTQDSPTGYFELIRKNASFRYLWFGQIVSLFGDWFNLIASAALVATLTQSGFAVGGLFIGSCPFQRPRRRMLFGGQRRFPASVQPIRSKCLPVNDTRVAQHSVQATQASTQDMETSC